MFRNIHVCYSRWLVRDKHLGVPAFVKLVHSTMGILEITHKLFDAEQPIAVIKGQISVFILIG